MSNSTAEETTITATADLMVTAVFVRQWELVLDAQIGGSVREGGNYDTGTTVSISANPEEGYRFAGWTGTGITDVI